jgi:hypothetical protein
MGDFLMINNLVIDNYLMRFHIKENARQYLLNESNSILTMNLDNGGESIFQNPNNLSALMPVGCPDVNNPMCPPVTSFYSQPYVLEVIQFGTGTNLGNILDIYVNPIIQPPITTTFVDGVPPEPIIRMNGTLSSQNNSVEVYGEYEPMYDFEDQVCADSSSSFCEDIGDFDEDDFYFDLFEDCMNGVDDDGDGYIDNEDTDCSWLPDYNIATEDNYVPIIMRIKTFSFSNQIMFDFETDLSTNATITVYKQGIPKTGSVYSDEHICSNISQIVTEMKTSVNGFYAQFHHLEAVNLDSGTSYYYEIGVCTSRDKCSKSYCKRVETTSSSFETTDFNLDFNPPERGNFAQQPMVKLVTNGVEEDLVAGTKRNIRNATLKFSVPEENIGVDFKGIDLIYNYNLNLTSSFRKFNDSEGRPIIGMDHSRWLDIAQNLGVKAIDLTIPYGGNQLFKCDSDGDNCKNVTSKVVRKSSNTTNSVWTVPVSLGFSTYKVVETPESEGGDEGTVTPVTGSPGGGGGGGGGAPPISFTLNKEKIDVKSKQGSVEDVEFTITNNRDIQINVEISSDSGLIDVVDAVALEVGETKTIKARVIVPDETTPEMYLGKIILKFGTFEKEITVAMEVTSTDYIFDTGLNIPYDSRYLVAGDTLSAEISLTKIVAEGVNGEVKVSYTIKNEDGEVIFSDADTRLVDTSLRYVKDISLPQDISNGKYVLYVQVTYEGKIASASSWFEVGNNLTMLFFMKNIYWIILILALVIGLVIYFVWRRNRL